jgi:hypothetical protein
VAAGCTAIVGRLAVGANAAIVARPSASEKRSTFARNAKICFYICCRRSSSCSYLNSACYSSIDIVAMSHGSGGWVDCGAASLTALALCGANSSRVNASTAGDVAEATSCCWRASVAGRVAVEAAWVEGMDATVAS